MYKILVVIAIIIIISSIQLEKKDSKKILKKNISSSSKNISNKNNLFERIKNETLDLSQSPQPMPII